MRRKKSITFSHTQHRTTPIPCPISTKENEWGRVRKRGDLHKEQEKVNKGKKTGEKLKENKLIMLN